jgi:hypothetical protein
MHDCYHDSMRQLTLRVPDQLAEDLKATAVHEGESVNAFAVKGLTALVDPDAAGEEMERLRERLRRAGLLDEWRPDRPIVRPSEEEVARARAAAGRGRHLLSDLVSEGRGD